MFAKSAIVVFGALRVISRSVLNFNTNNVDTVTYFIRYDDTTAFHIYKIYPLCHNIMHDT